MGQLIEEETDVGKLLLQRFAGACGHRLAACRAELATQALLPTGRTVHGGTSSKMGARAAPHHAVGRAGRAAYRTHLPGRMDAPSSC
ncbi:hypothetical protein D187_001558 [Cystobacter fuscus DSM 2262]|uniref:Uncharacterized protein n=1 Tax=Cystobacter fuscus (strain ATCC 25194 / DSM 2262 / NBRC 100088 / M29) TaxID=1242864 RepID=S9PCS6_CYSF2|nr:hypothetical protein D187_001558 [Cystobacter fuscus DSM 2262]